MHCLHVHRDVTTSIANFTNTVVLATRKVKSLAITIKACSPRHKMSSESPGSRGPRYAGCYSTK